jgi:hypothetical protein
VDILLFNKIKNNLNYQNTLILLKILKWIQMQKLQENLTEQSVHNQQQSSRNLFPINHNKN